MADVNAFILLLFIIYQCLSVFNFHYLLFLNKRVEFTQWNFNLLQSRIRTGQTPLQEERMKDSRDYSICFLVVVRKLYRIRRFCQ